MSAPTQTRSSGADDQDQSGAPGKGPFYEDLHQTPPAPWVAVVLMCVGVALVGGGVVALSVDTATAVVLFVAGVVLGVIGLALGLHNQIMTNVE